VYNQIEDYSMHDIQLCIYIVNRFRENEFLML